MKALFILLRAYWALKNWYFKTTVLEKTFESPLDCKEIKSVNPKGKWKSLSCVWLFATSCTIQPMEFPRPEYCSILFTPFSRGSSQPMDWTRSPTLQADSFISWATTGSCWCWSWSSKTLATWCEELTHWRRPWCWEILTAGEGEDRGWDGWMAPLTQWTWVWANSGRPGEGQGNLACCSRWGCRVGHNWATEQEEWALGIL